MERHELETVIYEKEGPIARIILNRPEKANSQNSPMVWDVENSLKDAEADYAIKVVILKANGRGFCAGHDVGGPGPSFPEFAEAADAGHPWGGQATLFLWPVLHLWEFQKPTVAAVQGYCVGGGTYFALLNDIVVASDDAYFQMPLPQGLGFPGGETMVEPWVMMNFHQAYEYLYLSQTVDAEEAKRLGMVNRVVPRDQLDDTVELIAQQIAQAPLSVLMGIKAGVKRAWESMGMRVHLQSQLQLMQVVGHAGDVAAWRQENRDSGYGMAPRQVAARRAELAAEAAGARRARVTPDRSPMTVDLRGRSFVKELDFTADEILHLLGLARDLKAAKRGGYEREHLHGKNIALIFEKTSTRTRCAFEVAAHDQGAHVTYLGPEGTQIGHKESMKDTARVLGRMFDAIEYRGFSQEVVEELARYAGVPVYNGLTDDFHPTQMLADILTMREHAGKPLGDISFCYLGDAAFNTGNSLLIIGAMLGMDVRICAPKQLWPGPRLIQTAADLAAASGSRLTFTEDIDQGVLGADFLCTDVWLSMGQPASQWEERIEWLLPYQVNMSVISRTGNPHVKFMHCLPAFHNLDTTIGQQLHEAYGLDALEVTDEVFESPYSIVFDEAENRVHTIKAILVATLGG